MVRRNLLRERNLSEKLDSDFIDEAVYEKGKKVGSWLVEFEEHEEVASVIGVSHLDSQGDGWLLSQVGGEIWKEHEFVELVVDQTSIQYSVREEFWLVARETLGVQSH